MFCALTLVLKHKLRTKRQAFRKFGRKLADPETDVKLTMLSVLKAQHNFRGLKAKSPADNLRISWFSKVTKSTLYQKCALCQSINQVEMHHIRKVKDVRGRIRTGNNTYAKWVRAYKQKQVSLYAYHYDLLHREDLNYTNMKVICNYFN